MDLRRCAAGLAPCVVIASVAWCAPTIVGTVTVGAGLPTNFTGKPAAWTGKLANGFSVTLNPTTHAYFNQAGAPGLTYTVVAGKKAPSDDPTPANPIFTFSSRKPTVSCYRPQFSNDTWYSVIIQAPGASSPWYAFKTGSQGGAKLKPTVKQP